MKKICTALCALLLAFTLLLGLVSLFDQNPVFSPKEQRELAEKPGFSMGGLLDGSWYESVRIYYADHFPGRENLLDLYFTLDGSAEPATTETE